MTPELEANWQKQLIVGENGDCLRAAFANCLGLPVESLPNYENEAWFEHWVEWFRERGIGLVWYGFRPEVKYGFPGLYVLSVKSPRLAGRTHCVVAKDGDVVFDPHPNADETPCDPETANGAYLFHALDAGKMVSQLSAERKWWIDRIEQELESWSHIHSDDYYAGGQAALDELLTAVRERGASTAEQSSAAAPTPSAPVPQAETDSPSSGAGES